MITTHELIKGTSEEILQHITSKPTYSHRDSFDIQKQLDSIGLEKQGMLFYLEQPDEFNLVLKSVYVHVVDAVAREQARKDLFSNLDSKATFEDAVVKSLPDNIDFLKTDTQSE